MMKLRGLYSYAAVLSAALPFAHGLALLSAVVAVFAAIVAALAGYSVLAWLLVAYAILTPLFQIATRMR